MVARFVALLLCLVALAGCSETSKDAAFVDALPLPDGFVLADGMTFTTGSDSRASTDAFHALVVLQAEQTVRWSCAEEDAYCPTWFMLAMVPADAAPEGCVAVPADGPLMREVSVVGAEGVVGTVGPGVFHVVLFRDTESPAGELRVSFDGAPAGTGARPFPGDPFAVAFYSFTSTYVQDDTGSLDVKKDAESTWWAYARQSTGALTSYAGVNLGYQAELSVNDGCATTTDQRADGEPGGPGVLELRANGPAGPVAVTSKYQDLSPIGLTGGGSAKAFVILTEPVPYIENLVAVATNGS